MLVTVSGFANTGKDSVADLLCRTHEFVRVSLADPLKRAAQDFYGFTDEQLWGPSHMRNAPDPRYPREHTWQRNGKESTCACCGQETTRRMIEDDLWVENEVEPCFLTCRYALQNLGTEHGRHCYPDIWVEYAIRVHDRLQQGGCVYDQKGGVRFTSMVDSEMMTSKKNVVIPDTRFRNELRLIRQAGGLSVRVKRPGVETPAWQHASETEQLSIPDSEFNYFVVNDGTLDDLAQKVQAMIEKLPM